MKWINRSINVMKNLAEVEVLFCMVSVCYSVVMRYLFHRPTGWVDEVNEYLLYYLAFLSAAWVLEVDGHVRLDVVLNLLSRRTQRMMNIITNILGIVYCGVLFFWGVHWVWTSIQRTERFSNTTSWLVAPVIVVLPVGALFLILVSVKKIMELARFVEAGKEAVIYDRQ